MDLSIYELPDDEPAAPDYAAPTEANQGEATRGGRRLGRINDNPVHQKLNTFSGTSFASWLNAVDDRVTLSGLERTTVSGWKGGLTLLTSVEDLALLIFVKNNIASEVSSDLASVLNDSTRYGWQGLRLVYGLRRAWGLQLKQNQKGAKEHLTTIVNEHTTTSASDICVWLDKVAAAAGTLTTLGVPLSVREVDEVKSQIIGILGTITHNVDHEVIDKSTLERFIVELKKVVNRFGVHFQSKATVDSVFNTLSNVTMGAAPRGSIAEPVQATETQELMAMVKAVLQMQLTGGSKRTREQRLCPNCKETGHSVGLCDAKPCVKCGSRQHGRANCNTTVSVACGTCGKMGHLQEACFQAKIQHSRNNKKGSSTTAYSLFKSFDQSASLDWRARSPLLSAALVAPEIDVPTNDVSTLVLVTGDQIPVKVDEDHSNNTTSDITDAAHTSQPQSEVTEITSEGWHHAGRLPLRGAERLQRLVHAAQQRLDTTYLLASSSSKRQDTAEDHERLKCLQQISQRRTAKSMRRAARLALRVRGGGNVWTKEDEQSVAAAIAENVSLQTPTPQPTRSATEAWVLDSGANVAVTLSTERLAEQQQGTATVHHVGGSTTAVPSGWTILRLASIHSLPSKPDAVQTPPIPTRVIKTSPANLLALVPLLKAGWYMRVSGDGGALVAPDGNVVPIHIDNGVLTVEVLKDTVCTCTSSGDLAYSTQAPGPPSDLLSGSEPLPQGVACSQGQQPAERITSTLAHKRFAHMDKSTIKSRMDNLDWLVVEDTHESQHPCYSCVMAKLDKRRRSSGPHAPRAIAPNTHWSIDSSGPKTLSKLGNVGYITFGDYFSGARHSYGKKNDSSAEALRVLKMHIRRRFKTSVPTPVQLTVDSAFSAGIFDDYVQNTLRWPKPIVVTPYEHASAGHAEAGIKRSTRNTSAFLHGSNTGPPYDLWDFALEQQDYIINHSRTIDGGPSPAELDGEQYPYIQRGTIFTWGCLCAYRTENPRKGTFEARARLGIHLGFDQNSTFRAFHILSLETGRFVRSGSVRFFEHILPRFDRSPAYIAQLRDRLRGDADWSKYPGVHEPINASQPAEKFTPVLYGGGGGGIIVIPPQVVGPPHGGDAETNTISNGVTHGGGTQGVGDVPPQDGGANETDNTLVDGLNTMESSGGAAHGYGHADESPGGDNSPTTPSSGYGHADESSDGDISPSTPSRGDSHAVDYASSDDSADDDAHSGGGHTVSAATRLRQLPQSRTGQQSVSRTRVVQGREFLTYNRDTAAHRQRTHARQANNQTTDSPPATTDSPLATTGGEQDEAGQSQTHDVHGDDSSNGEDDSDASTVYMLLDGTPFPAFSQPNDPPPTSASVYEDRSRPPVRMPKSTKALGALSKYEQDLIRRAMDEEISGLEALPAWKEIRLHEVPKGVQIIPTKWVHTRKPPDPQDQVRIKSRLVARGDRVLKKTTDRHFAPTIHPAIVKVQMTHYLSRRRQLRKQGITNLTLRSFDVKQAFLKSTPPGTTPVVISMRGSDGVLRYYILLRSLYGFPWAPKAWFDRISSDLREFGLSSFPDNPAFFTNPSHSIFLSLHVDDGLVTANTTDCDALMAFLRSKYGQDGVSEQDMTKGSNRYLGIRWTLDLDNDTVTADQTEVIDALLVEHGLDGSTKYPVKTPVVPDMQLVPTLEPNDNPRFTSLVGSLLWLLHTRPELGWACSQLSRCMRHNDATHMSYALRVLRYLKGTRTIGLTLRGVDNPEISGWSDSSYAEDPLTRRSSSGIMFTYGSSLIFSKAFLQPSVTVSSMEAELMALFEAVMYAIFLRKLTNFMGLGNAPTILRIDSKSAQLLTDKGTPGQRSKHLDVRFHKIVESINAGEVILLWVPTKVMAADILTKPLSFPRFQSLVNPIRSGTMDFGRIHISQFCGGVFSLPLLCSKRDKLIQAKHLLTRSE